MQKGPAGLPSLSCSGCVLDRDPNHLGRIDDALGDQVSVLAGLAIEAIAVLILLQDLADDALPKRNEEATPRWGTPP
jgi:hypothetical protein